VRARASFDFALQVQGDRIARACVVFSGIAPVPWPAPAQS
jgi:hypothetical protein